MTTDEMIAVLQEHEKRILKLESLLTSKSPTQTVLGKGMSVKEFLLTKKTKDDVQKTLCIGYYLEKFENAESFNASDVESCFRKAKEQVPTNINDKINMNIKKGFIMDSKEKKNNKKAWTLTSTGEAEVESNLTK